MTQELTNEEQISYWNEEAGPKWVDMQESLDAQIGPLGEAMIAKAAVRPGERILDIGCGCGASSLDLAARVGDGGGVTGVDISEPMLERARQRAREHELANIEFVRADAQNHAFEAGSKDLATSRFGVMFFADPKAAFANIRKALKPGGRLAFVCWQPLPLNSWVAIPMQVAAQHIEMPDAPAPGAPGPFSLSDKEHLHDILDTAGYREISIESDVREMAVGGAVSLDKAIGFTQKVGPLSRLLEDVSESKRLEVLEAIKTAVQPYYRETGLMMTWSIWLVTAINDS